MSVSKRLPIITALIAGALIMFCFFGPIISAPNSFLLSPGGDGLKNYYTPAYYLKYDTGWEFTGMNYPFGEHITYTDNQPAVSAILNKIDSIVPIHNYSTGILNILIITSLFLCIPVLYAILKHYGLPSWYAAAAALIISFLSPQVARMSGHYALAYPLFFPLAWLLWIKTVSRETVQLIPLLLLLIWLVFTGFIHLYFLLIGAMFFFLLGVLHFFNIGFGKNIAKGVAALTVAIAPFLIVFLTVRLTDSITDRPPTPFGFFYYKASLESVFLPVYSPLIDLLNKIIDVRKANTEGYAYVGIAGSLVMLATLWRVFRNLIRGKKWSSFNLDLPKGFGTVLLVAIIILLFSMAVPFKFGLEFLLDIIPGLKQFRSPGRFAWVFFYVFTVYAALFIHRTIFTRAQKKTGIGYVVLFIFLTVISVYDAFINIQSTCNYVVKNHFPNVFREEADVYNALLRDNGKKANDFQAILTLPYYQMGSEKLYITRSTTAISEGMKASYDTGLPLAQGMLSRTSLSQTYELVQLISDPIIPKKILDRFNNKPILLIWTGEELTAAEKYIRESSNQFAEYGRHKIYTLPVSAFEDTSADVVLRWQLDKDSLFKVKDDVFTSAQAGLIIQENFEGGKKDKLSLSGEGFLFREDGEMVIYNEKIDTSWSGEELNISMWVRSYSNTTAYPIIKHELSGGDGAIISKGYINPKESTEVTGEWVRVEADVQIPEYAERLEIDIKGEWMGIDQLLIRKRGVEVFHSIDSDSVFWYNNFPVGI